MRQSVVSSLKGQAQLRGRKLILVRS